ncbi:MAG: peptidyl-prolyl cis-trans isomerase D [Rickettsiales bacterium]|jgi:peptidyl-prolyl cis-trans isomerase D
MEKFRNLSSNIFFKIFLGFLGLTFIMFGVSGFILGGNEAWIAKIGNKTITYNKFLRNVQGDREAIYRSNPTPEAMEYLNSEPFKQDVLGRIVTRSLIQGLQKEFQIYPDKTLILQEIVKNDAMQGANGKFSRVLYQNFLRINGLSEKQHISDLSDEIVGGIVVQSLVKSPKYDNKIAKDLQQYRLQTRNVDVLTISTQDISNPQKPNDFELNAYFEKNKAEFTLPELRKISFISFGLDDLKKEIKISDVQIAAQYEENKSEYLISQNSDFYHISFNDESEAKEFHQSLTNSDNKNKSEAFITLAEDLDKGESNILLANITPKDLPKNIGDSAFSLQKGQISEIVKSDIGFHVFYLLKQNPEKQLSLIEVREEIEAALISRKEENQIDDNLKQIEDEILATNSIIKVAAKINAPINKNLPKFNSQGLDSKNNLIADLKDFDDLVKNSFELEKGKLSKIFSSQTNKKYYILLVEEIDPKRQRSLDEVKVAATDLWIFDQKQKNMKDLAKKITDQINQDGGDANKIATKNGFKLEINREFPRFYVIDAGNGRKVPYASQILKEIFALEIGKATNPEKSGAEEMTIGVVRKINNPTKNETEVQEISEQLENDFNNDILNAFNNYVKNKFPVRINNKLMESGSNPANNE